MTARPLTRAGIGSGAAPPVRIVHLGLGAFSRSHLAWYTAHASDAPDWGIAAYSGRSAALAVALAAQDGISTLIQRGPDVDTFELVGSIARAHAADDHDRWLADLADPSVRVVTTTVTEAGWCRSADGTLDVAAPAITADLDALRRDLAAPVSTAPARLVAGLAARRRAEGGGLTVVPGDNLLSNGATTRGVLVDFAERIDETLASWIDTETTFASTMVDRITPATTAADRAAVVAATGWIDQVPVVTEPFSEWVIAGLPVGSHPDWSSANARLVDDVAPYEQRKLTLLNGAHSLLAYLGSIRGHTTVAEAFGDPVCRRWVERWWVESEPYLAVGGEDAARSAAALTERFANPRIEHRLSQIAQDGSQKIPVRILPTVRAARFRGASCEAAQVVVAAWIVCLRGGGAPVVDPLADRLIAAAAGDLRNAVPRVVALLDPEMADDEAFVAAVVDQIAELSRAG